MLSFASWSSILTDPINLATAALAAFSVAFAALVWHLYDFFFARPRKLIHQLRAQGVAGYPFRPFVGQLPELLQEIKKMEKDPEYREKQAIAKWWTDATEAFGSTWIVSIGPYPRVVLTDPTLIRQVYIAQNDVFEKNNFMRNVELFGEGLVTSSGALWHRQRRLINPAFSNREIKRIFPTMVDCAASALAKVGDQVERNLGAPVRMDVVFSWLTLDVICRAAFGSQIEELFGSDVLQKLMSAFTEYCSNATRVLQFVGIFPAFKYLPVETNRKVWRSSKVIRSVMERIISVRQELHDKKKNKAKVERAVNSSSSGSVDGEGHGEGEGEGRTDLLELMMSATEGLDVGGEKVNGGPEQGSEGAKGVREKEKPLSQELLMANSITFLIAGHETTANALTWACFELGRHQEWQEKARAEVNALFDANGGKSPSFDQLNELKQLGWILNETLRLYPPASILGRVSTKAVKLTDTLTVPKGCDVTVPVFAIHRSKELWGEDADVFKPERFANGIGKASAHPHAFMPFSLGPRVCIGQNFALVEAKAVLALLLRQFSWKVADSYVHFPDMTFALKPKLGLPIVLTPISPRAP